MGEAGFFKTTAVGGFDKKSVLTYIDSLNEGFHSTELEYKAKLAEFDKAQETQVAHIKKLEAQLAEQNAKLEAVARQLETERGLAKQAQEMIASLDEQTKVLQKQLSDNDREMQIQLERNRQLQFKAESLDYKSKKYDELSTQIGDTLIDAKQQADRIIADANNRSAEIIHNARSTMQGFCSEISSFKGDSARLRKSVEEILFVLNDRVDVMQEILRQVEKRFTASPLDFTEEKEPFENPSDQTGFLGGAAE